MPYNDSMEPKYLRLLKADGHLGALFDPNTNQLRLVCRAGTVDIDLNALIAKEARRQERMTQATD